MQKKTVKFFHQPKKGDKVKVYVSHFGEPAYGIVLQISTKRMYKNDEYDRKEIVICEQSNIPFNILDCKYCLDKNRVKFI